MSKNLILIITEAYIRAQNPSDEVEKSDIEYLEEMPDKLKFNVKQLIALMVGRIFVDKKKFIKKFGKLITEGKNTVPRFKLH